MRIPLFAVLAGVVLAGCATHRPGPPVRDAAVERGQRFAQRACAGCHDLGNGDSPRSGAPNFATLQLRFNPIALERHLSAISAHGHYEMPPIYILPNEAHDLVAYIDSVPPR